MKHRIIILKGDPLHKEAPAAAPIVPGQLVEHTATGAVRPQDTAGAVTVKAFSVEAGFLGRDVDTPYSEGEQAYYAVCEPGCEVYAWLAPGETADPTVLLAAAGDGALKVAGEGDAALARALETVDNTDGETPIRVVVEVL